MRAGLILILAVAILLAGGLIALLVYAGTIQSDEGEVRIELEDTFPQ